MAADPQQLITYSVETSVSGKPIDPDKVKEYLAQGINCNALVKMSDSDPKVPLYLGLLWYAETYYDLEKSKLKQILELLIEYGADVKRKVRKGLSPIGFCVSQNCIKTANLLIDHGTTIEEDKNDLLLPVVNLPSWDSETGKEIAKLADYLIKAGCSPNTIDIKDKNKTTLMCATEMGQVETVKLLLDLGVDVNAQDNRGLTALMFACGDPLNRALRIMQMRPLTMFKVLIKAGADPKIESNQKRTALNIAKKTDYNPEGEYTAEEVKTKILRILEDAIT